MFAKCFWALQLKVLDKQGVTVKFFHFPNRCLGSLGMWLVVSPPLFNARRKIASCFVLIKLVYSSGSGKNRWWAPEEKPNPPSYLFSDLTIFNATEVLASQIYQVLPLLSVCLCVCVFGRGGDHVSDPAEFWSLVSQWLLMTVRTLHSIKKFIIYLWYL